jgi:hypothetical protein
MLPFTILIPLVLGDEARFIKESYNKPEGSDQSLLRLNPEQA